MNRLGEILYLTWPDGPIFRLDRTTLRLKLLADEENRLLASVPSFLRQLRLVRALWLRRLYGPHFFDAVELRFEEPVLSFRPANVRNRPAKDSYLSWRVPPENAVRAARFVDELSHRSALRQAHRVEGGRGRSLVPFAVLFVALFWLVRRLRAR